MAITCPDLEHWNDLLEERLAPAEQAELSTHLDWCRECERTLERLTIGEAAWVDAARNQEPPTRPALRSVIEKLKTVDEAALETVGMATVGDASLAFLRPPVDPVHLGRIGAYEVLEVLGRGGMGVVLKAYDVALGRMVAIKVLAPQLATSAAARQRFAREAHHTAQVHHDNVVAIHAVHEIDGLPYLVMEYVPGMSLQQRLDRDGRLNLETILRIGAQTAAGLAAAHAAGLIHRDIKPANILLDVNGNVKITDFGLARATDDASLTQAGVIAGTPQYMAPEQAHGAPLDHRADLFSLGSVLYAMCTGRPPFRAPTTVAVLKNLCDETPEEVRNVNPSIPAWLSALIGRLHAKSPADRFQTANEVAELLTKYLRNPPLPEAATRPAPGVRTTRSHGWWRWAVAAIVAASLPILACGALGYWLLQGPEGGVPQPPKQDEVPFEKILADLDKNDVFARRDALKRLAEMKPNDQRPAVAKKLLALTEVADPHVRRPAVIALGVWGTDKEVPGLIKALEHADVFTRREALRVIGRFRDERSVAPVIRTFRENQTRADAAKALRDLGTMAEKDLLVLMKEDNVFLKKDTILVLADIGTDASLPVLKDSAASASIFLVEPARNAMRAIAERSKKK